METNGRLRSIESRTIPEVAMPRPLPPRIDCETCGKPTNQRGYAGPECQCGVKLETKPSHSIGTRKKAPAEAGADSVR